MIKNLTKNLIPFSKFTCCPVSKSVYLKKRRKIIIPALEESIESGDCHRIGRVSGCRKKSNQSRWKFALARSEAPNLWYTYHRYAGYLVPTLPT
ncbi:hypothetical protein AVEN_74643-1 [Araneus ventricosus]|uniref:Uncharacterized protein n=1 Tax=Araneus ventricosus TaxID=182803 RepID=A0A4Y2EXF6_ARAVE|nr:hypothetical protein AVEN_74643-1 [Araneus ventricosus]